MVQEVAHYGTGSGSLWYRKWLSVIRTLKFHELVLLPICSSLSDWVQYDHVD